MKRRIACIPLLIAFIVSGTKSLSQNCDSKYLSIDFKASTFEFFSNAAFTPENELVTAGHLLDYNGAGHLARFSKNGIPLWSNFYTVNYFNFYYPTFLRQIEFKDFFLTDDGGMIAGGKVERYYDNRVRLEINQMALIAKIDKYGNVEWSHTFLPANYAGDMCFSKVCKTPDGDIIAYMANDNGPSVIYNIYSYDRVIRFTSQGQIKWSTLLYTGNYDSRGNGVLHKRGLVQLSDNNIVVANAVYKSDVSGNMFKITDGRLHFLSLNYDDGKIKWESDYPYTLPPNDPFFSPDIQDISQLPGGGLSIMTSLYITTLNSPLLSLKPVNIITNARGEVQKIVSYNNTPGNNLSLIDAEPADAAGNRKILFADNNFSTLSDIQKEGSVVSSKGYSGSYPANCFATCSRGTGILRSDFNSLRFSLMLTDSEGDNGCENIPAAISSDNATISPDTGIVTTSPMINTISDYRLYFTDYEYPLIKKAEYPLERTVNCEQQVACCHDIIDSLNITKIRICEGSTFTLPGNSIVKDSGTYYVTYKTSGGCDSITYYEIAVDKNIRALTLGNDTCIKDQNTVKLYVPEGYKNYNWMGTISFDSTYLVNAPGKYWVNVTNVCGSKTDSIEVFDQCDFPVYMPTAFTPNGDNLNDYFGVPDQNKNRLIELRIYNRWGQLIFQTNTKAKKWDGKWNGLQQSTGVFAYSLVMEGLSGKRILYNGTVTLIR